MKLMLRVFSSLRGILAAKKSLAASGDAANLLI